MTRSSRTQPDGRQMQLQPLTETGAHQIERWFDHPEIERRLGGRFWIHRELRMISRHSPTAFRGAVVMRSHGWIGLDHLGKPVAFICGDVDDRCGIDVDNRASRTCAESAGFTLADLEPDHEGMLYYRRTRST